MLRRSLLKSLLSGSALTALPISASMIRAAHASQQANSDTNFIFFYSPDGCTPHHWHPNETMGQLILNKQTSVLEDIKQHIVFLKGMNMYDEDGDFGSGSHEGGIKRVLTANAKESIDMYLGRRIQAEKTPMPYSNLHLGVFANVMFSNDARMSYNQAGKEPSYVDDPVHAFNSYFGDVAQTPTGLMRESWVIDNINKDLNSLKSRLGYQEVQRLGIHTEALFELEQRLKNPPSSSASGCASINFNSNNIDTSGEFMHQDDMADSIFDLQSDVAVNALTCGLTRVVSVSLSHKVSPNKFGLNFGEHHSTSHSVSDAFDGLKRYSNTKFKQLVQKLDNQGLLHNTVVLHCSEIGNSGGHDQTNMPFMLAGQGGHNIQGGRMINCAGMSHARLLTSFAHMAGLTDVQRYGYDGQNADNQGPMSQLFS